MNIHREHLLVVVDPTTSDGEAGLAEAEAVLVSGGAVTLLTFLTGSPALRAFAQGEEVSIGEAGDIYLAQVAERLAAPSVGALSSLGADVAAELLGIVAGGGFSRVVVPASVAVRLPAAVADLASRAPIPVTITAGRTSAA